MMYATIAARLRGVRPAGQRSGFTLLEVVVAIVLTGVVALLVYGAAGVAVDTQARLAERTARLRARQAWRAIVQEAFRNARPAVQYGDTAFILEERTVGGRPADRVTFITAGSMPPLTPDADWTVVLETTEEGLVLWAQPLGVLAPPRRLVGVQAITGLNIRALDPSPQGGWVDGWRYPQRLPMAIELNYWTGDGPSGVLELVWLPLGGSQ